MGFSNPLVSVRVVLNAAAADVVTLYTGDAEETSPASLTADVAGGGTPAADRARVAVVTPLVGSAATPASLALLAESRDGGTSQSSAAELAAESITLGSLAAIIGGDALVLDDTGLSLAGIPIRPMAAARQQLSTDANGYMTITHNLGYVPQHISAMVYGLYGTDAVKRLSTPVLDSVTSTTFTLRWRREDTNAWYSGAQTIGVQWSAA